ncbi:MAG: AAA family ATPase [Pseudonocardiaceae bacterium]
MAALASEPYQRRDEGPPRSVTVSLPGDGGDLYHPGVVTTWPLTGRADELRRISGLIRRRDGPAGVVLAGTAGVGKTRLAREVLAAEERRGALIRWAVATASARVLPLGAFAAMLGAVSPDPSQLVRQAGDALLTGAGRAGVIVAVDDAHLLDELSALLIHQLVLRRAAGVVLTLRTGETAPDAVTALWKDEHLPRVELQPLSQAQTVALVEESLGGPVDSAAARRLWTITLGNVLYLRQLVGGELESGRLRQVAGVWRWSGEPKLSPGLVELVRTRIGRLPDAQSDVVEVLAFAEPLEMPLLAGLTGAAAVEQAEARGLVEVYPDGGRLQVRLAHPLYGEVQRAHMGTLRARRLRGRIARALAGTGGRRSGDILCRAVLTLDSDLPADPVLFTEAARGAFELGDLTLAHRLARAAVAAGGGFDSRLLLAHALTWSGRGAEAETELAALGAHTDAEQARVTIARVEALAFTLGRPAEGEAVLDAAVSTISDPVARLELAGMRSTLDAFLGRSIPAAQAAAGVLADPRCSPPSAYLASWGLATACGGLGRLDGLDENVARIDALTDSLQLGLPEVAVVGSLWLRALLLAGLLDRAECISRRYRERCQDAPGPLDAVTGAMCRGGGVSRTGPDRGSLLPPSHRRHPRRGSRWLGVPRVGAAHQRAGNGR